MTAEQEARDMLERMGVENAQRMTAGDLVELANLIADRKIYTGFNDRNGRKIYEGNKVKNIRTGEIIKIEFEKIGRGCEPFIEFAGSGWQCSDGDDCEVID